MGNYWRCSNEVAGRRCSSKPATPTPDAVAGGIVTLAQDRPRRFTVERVDGDPTTSSVLEAPLLEQGFVVGYKGLSYRPPSGRGRR